MWPSWPHACIRPGTSDPYGRTRRLVDRERVHVGAKEDRPPLRRLRREHADHARFRDSGPDAEVERPQVSGHERRRLVLFEPSSGRLWSARRHATIGSLSSSTRRFRSSGIGAPFARIL